MAKKTAVTKKAAARKKAAQRQPARSAPTIIARPKPDDGTAMYELLKPTKVRGKLVKPPCWIEMTAAEAQPYQDAGVLGEEPGEVPTGTDTNTTPDDDEQTAGTDASTASGSDAA